MRAGHPAFHPYGSQRVMACGEPVFGLLRAKALIFLADVLDTLSTLTRLVREATLASRSP